ncbi:hypothetical protein ACWZEH_13050 [Streptomyces sp. QTS137]
MPKVQKPKDLLQRLAELEDRVDALAREGWERDELPLYPASQHGLAYDDAPEWRTLWEATFTPRTATLQLGLVFLGDIVSGTNTGGEWQVVFADSTVVASGTVPATFAYTRPALTLDLTSYRSETQLRVRVQVRRTAGATTGGKFGGGGSIGGAPQYARLL